MEAHQQAYTLWRKLLSNVHNDEAIGSVVMECQDWWDKNCLYLDSEVREAFRLAYHTAFQHRDLLRARANIKDIEKNWSDVKRAGEVIVKAVELPTIRDLESEVIKLKEQ